MGRGTGAFAVPADRLKAAQLRLSLAIKENDKQVNDIAEAKKKEAHLKGELAGKQGLLKILEADVVGILGRLHCYVAGSINERYFTKSVPKSQWERPCGNRQDRECCHGRLHP